MENEKRQGVAAFMDKGIKSVYTCGKGAGEQVARSIENLKQAHSVWANSALGTTVKEGLGVAKLTMKDFDNIKKHLPSGLTNVTKASRDLSQSLKDTLVFNNPHTH